jgi:hypothetical protein
LRLGKFDVELIFDFDHDLHALQRTHPSGPEVAADVDPAAVVTDYLATDANLPALWLRWAERGYRTDAEVGRSQAWLDAAPDAITMVVDTLTTWRAGAVGWLADHGAPREQVEAWQVRIADSSTRQSAEP